MAVDSSTGWNRTTFVHRLPDARPRMSPRRPGGLILANRGLAAVGVTFLAVALAAGVWVTRGSGQGQQPEPMAIAPSTRPRTAGSIPSDTTRPAFHKQAVVKPAPSRPASSAVADQLDPASWSSSQLAAVLLMTGAKMDDSSVIQHAAAMGIGGVVLFGPSSPDLAQTLSKARALAPKDNPLLIASDEEGGRVQRLASLIYPLPSAEAMGDWSPARITITARDYALRMRALGVNVALSPDADVAAAGYFIAATERSFSSDPKLVGVDVNAWNDGLEAAGVLGIIKHWPGHGHATDSQVGIAVTPPWSVLQGRDLIPFKAAIAHHADAVMIGHLRVPGLTEGSLPASESPTALRTLRAQAGAAVLIITDDLSMDAASKALGISPAQAAVRALVAGADVAMVCWAPIDGVTSAVTQALNDGQFPRAQAVASARRVLRAKRQVAS